MRTKSNVLLERRYSQPVDKSTGVLSDQTVILSSLASATAYPDTPVSYTHLDVYKRQVWGLPTRDLAQEMIASGVRAKLTCIDTRNRSARKGHQPASGDARWLSQTGSMWREVRSRNKILQRDLRRLM